MTNAHAVNGSVSTQDGHGAYDGGPDADSMTPHRLQQPEVSATVNDDGLAQVIIDGHAHPVSGASVSASRENVVRFIAARVASELGHPVQVEVADPEGPLSLLIHPNATVEVLPVTESRRATRRRSEATQSADEPADSAGSLGSSMDLPSEAALQAVSAELTALPPVQSGLPSQRQPHEFVPQDAATEEFSAVRPESVEPGPMSHSGSTSELGEVSAKSSAEAVEAEPLETNTANATSSSAPGVNSGPEVRPAEPRRSRSTSSLALSALEPLAAPRPVQIPPRIVESFETASYETTSVVQTPEVTTDVGPAESESSDADSSEVQVVHGTVAARDDDQHELSVELFTHAPEPGPMLTADFPPAFSPLPEADTETFPVGSSPWPAPAPVSTPLDQQAQVSTPHDQQAQVSTPHDQQAQVSTPGDQQAQVSTPGDQQAQVWTPADQQTAVSTPHDQQAQVWTPSDQQPAVSTPADQQAQVWTPSDQQPAVSTPGEQQAKVWTPGEQQTVGTARPRRSGHHAAPAPEPGTPSLPTLDSLLAGRPAPDGGPAQMGWQGTVRRMTGGLISPKAGPVEVKHRAAIASVQRSLRGPKTVVVVNPKGGAHKTTASLLIAATFGIHRGGYTLAWDNNETRGTLGWRAAQTRHTNTAVDLLRDLERFEDARGARVGDLDNYVRTQGNAQFDVLASDEDAASAASIDGEAFLALHTSLSRFYRILVVDTGNNMRASNWQAAVNKADQLVIVSTIREDTAQSAAWLLDGLRAAGQEEAVANAVTVLSAPAKNIDPALSARLHTHFGQLTRAVLDVPHDPALVAGGPVDVERLADSTRESWLHVTAAVAEGL